MNKDTMEGSWKELRGRIKQKWGDITDQELVQVEGDRDRLFGLLQKRYGLAREEAKKQIDEIVESMSS